MQLYQFYQASLKGQVMSFKGKVVFEKHLNASSKDTNENTFKFSLSEVDKSESLGTNLEYIAKMF